MDLVSINGDFNQSIPATDRGLLFGESVYEVIPIYNKKAFYIDEHLARLQKGFYYFSPNPLPINTIKKMITEFIKKMPYQLHDNIYIQVTTGHMTIRDHKPDDSLKPNIIIHKTQHAEIVLKDYIKGFKAICVPDQRSVFSNIKSNHLAYNIQALREAAAQQCQEAIFIKNNCLVEAASSNIFVVINGTLITPPTEGILAGLTRERVLMIAKKHGIPYEIATIPLSELNSVDEIFLSSSIKLLRPIIEVKGRFQKKTTGPIWLKLFNLYNEMIHEYCNPSTTIS